MTEPTPKPVHTIEFIGDGNAIVRRTDGKEHLMGADDVPEFLLAERRQQRERCAAALSDLAEIDGDLL